MMTVHEVRRERLQMLAQQHGQMANLCEALGYARTDTARLTRIANANIRHERDGKPYVMGDDMARDIEEKLGLERGWMDTPPGYELATDPKLRELHRVAQVLQPYQLNQLITIGSTLAQTPRKDELSAQPQAKVAENAPASSGGGMVLKPVQGVAAKKIGRGYFGPPADEPKRGESGQSSRNSGRTPRKGHAGGS